MNDCIARARISMSIALSQIAQMHFHDRLHTKENKTENKEEPCDQKTMNLQMNVDQRMDVEDQNSCGTSISNSLDNSTNNDSDLENDHPTLVPNEDMNANDESINSMFQPAQDIVKKEFPLEFGFGSNKAKKESEDVIGGTFPGTSGRSPFLLPAQLYKNFFASFGKRKRSGPDAECPAAGFQVYPRNMLFSTGNRPGGGLFFNGSDDENAERVTDSPVDEVYSR